MIQDEDDLVEAILGMPFGKLMKVGHELVSLVAEANSDAEIEGRPIARDLNTPVGMAEMLYDWAESKKED
jgi:hypothetical protein